jgi:hypothetical protein
LLAFSDEFQNLADGRVDADNLAMCAIERFETDGHAIQWPLLVSSSLWAEMAAFPTAAPSLQGRSPVDGEDTPIDRK